VRTVAKKSLAAIAEAVDAETAAKNMAALEGPLKTLQSAKTSKEKITALQRLGELGGAAREAGAAIVSIGLLDSRAIVKEAATNALAKIDPRAHKEIMVLLNDKDAEKKAASIHALIEMGHKGKAAAPILKLIYVEDRKDLIGKGLWEPALEALAKVTPDDSTVHDDILAIIANPQESQNAQELALKLLKTVKVDTKKKVAALMVGVEKGMNYRAYMIGELGGMRGDAKAALPLLKNLKDDSDDEVRKAATDAINAIK
jgi:HEAT repeat protein